jgi:hypothetical protein
MPVIAAAAVIAGILKAAELIQAIKDMTSIIPSAPSDLRGRNTGG